MGWTFSSASNFAFLNWDDEAVILQNRALEWPGVLTWAFTTTYMEHYQPLSWLVWAGFKHAFGLDPSAFHVANVIAHIACVLLVWLVARLVLTRAQADLTQRTRDAAAFAAALLFGLHPLRVEVVAWISALPYALALALTLASLAAYVRAGVHTSQRWWMAALVLYAASLMARPVALGFPVVLIGVDVWLLQRSARASVRKVWPFAVFAVLAAVVESTARVPGLNDASWVVRLQWASSAPFVYLWHTVAPLGLTPLDALPLTPVARPGVMAAALLALVAVTVAAWTFRHRSPTALAAWVAYLALLTPAAGLVPSGLQLTADRYTYFPGVVVAMFVAGSVASWAARRSARISLATAAFLIVALACVFATRRTLAPWSDSISLWSRVVALEPTNDVGLYNLATALAAAGRAQEAEVQYRQLLTLQPGHASARANLDRLAAARLEGEGNASAARGDFAHAAERYQQAITLDPGRTHSHAGRGMALASLGRASEAIPALREAMRQGEREPAVPNALAVLLLQIGETREARTVMEAGLRDHPNDVNLAHNLARLLATTPGLGDADRALALTLARAVVESTRGRDPRATATLAEAFAANGRFAEASTTNARAAGLATAQGDHELAVQITARGARIEAPGSEKASLARS